MTTFTSFDNETVLKDLILRKEEELIGLKSKLKRVQDERDHYNRTVYRQAQENRARRMFERYVKGAEEWTEDKMENCTERARVIRVNCDEYSYDDSNNISEIPIEDMEYKPRFGDILDFTGYRHYSWRFVGKGGQIISSSVNLGYGGDAEYGVQVPWEITMWLVNPIEKYKDVYAISSYELIYNNLLLTSYKTVSLDKFYIYLHEVNDDEWHMYAYNEDGIEEELVKM